jgi:hypothetical protein
MKQTRPFEFSWTWRTVLAVLVAFAGLVWQGELWRFFGVLHLKPLFVDLAAILSAGQAYHAGVDIYRENPFDPFGRTHVYGPWWLVSGALGLKVSDAAWLGPICVGLFVIVAVRFIAPRTLGQSVGTVLLFLSPGVLLGLERANNDLIVFLLAAAAAWWAARPRWLDGWVATAVLVLVSVLKFYPLVMLGALLGRREPLRRRLILVVAGATAFGAAFLLQYDHFRSALTVAPRPISIFAYGYEILPLTFRLLPGSRGLLLAGFLSVLALWIWMLGRTARRWCNLLPLDDRRATLAVMTGLGWLLCYAATLNFPYRAVLLLPILPFLWSAPAGRTGRWIVGGLLGALWLGAPKLWFAPAAAGGAHEWRDAISLLSGFEQGAMLGITGLVVLLVGGWTWRAFFRRDIPDAQRAPAAPLG